MTTEATDNQSCTSNQSEDVASGNRIDNECIQDMRFLFNDKCDTSHTGDQSHTLIGDTNVTLNIGGKLITFLLDSGSQLSVLRKDLLPEDFSYDDGPPGRRVLLKGAFGPEVPAQLLKVEAALSDEFGSELPAVALNIALCDSLNDNIGLLSMHDYNVLRNATNIVCPDIKLLNNS